MRRWQSYYEILYFPLLTIFVTSVLLGFSGLILNSNFQSLIHLDNNLIIKTAEMMSYLCSFIIVNAPFLILIKILSRKYEDSTPVFIGVIAYFIFHISTMFFASNKLPSVVYSSVLGITVDASKISLVGSGMRYPIITGILAIFVVSFITRVTYKSSRKRSNYGYFAFINSNAWALIFSSLLTFIAGAITAFIWPYVINGLYYIFSLIANDITNPMNLFIYGILDRVMSITWTGSIIRNVFWFGELGGSWILNSVNYLGDVGVWTAQQANNIYNTGFGRLITPYFILNIFAVPAIMLATFTTFTDKLERKKYTLFLVLAIAISIISGSLLPIEIYLLIMTPLLYVFHLFYTGFLFAILTALNVSIGYSFSGSVNAASPGSIFDLLVHFRDSSFSLPLIKLIVVGIITFIVYYIVTKYYYRKGCLDILNTGSKTRYIANFVLAVGGINNIKRIYATPTKVIIQVEDATLLNFNLMQQQGASKVVETRTTFDISYGAISYLIVNEVNKLISLNLD